MKHVLLLLIFYRLGWEGVIKFYLKCKPSGLIRQYGSRIRIHKNRELSEFCPSGPDSEQIQKNIFYLFLMRSEENSFAPANYHVISKHSSYFLIFKRAIRSFFLGFLGVDWSD